MFQHKLTVVSYNVHECIGVDGRRDPDRIAQLIQQLDADIVGLQEVDFSPFNGNKSYQFNYLASATGLRGIAGPTFRRLNPDFGNALLTSREISRVDLHDVSVPGREPRGVIDADIICGGKLVRIIVTHLGLGLRERTRQGKLILKILDRRDDADCTVLLGDMNEWRPGGYVTRMLNRHLGKGFARRTFPAFFPLFPLDRLWVKPKTCLVNVKIPRNGLSRVASDHLPIRATINLEP